MTSNHREKRLEKNAELRKSIDKLIYDGHSFLANNLSNLDIPTLYTYLWSVVFEGNTIPGTTVCCPLIKKF